MSIKDGTIDERKVHAKHAELVALKVEHDARGAELRAKRVEADERLQDLRKRAGPKVWLKQGPGDFYELSVNCHVTESQVLQIAEAVKGILQ